MRARSALRRLALAGLLLLPLAAGGCIGTHCWCEDPENRFEGRFTGREAVLLDGPGVSPAAPPAPVASPS